jgi:hypothetical protein
MLSLITYGRLITRDKLSNYILVHGSVWQYQKYITLSQKRLDTCVRMHMVQHYHITKVLEYTCTIAKKTGSCQYQKLVSILEYYQYVPWYVHIYVLEYHGTRVPWYSTIGSYQWYHGTRVRTRVHHWYYCNTNMVFNTYTCTILASQYQEHTYQDSPG